MTCSTCRHFFAEVSACRRYPPTLVVIPQMTIKGPAISPAAYFPTVSPDTICGEHTEAPSA
jgi:hypothetical protein